MLENNNLHEETKVYTKEFYQGINEGSLRSAREVVPIIIDCLLPKNIVDIGCGAGAWLSVFEEHGVDVVGLDGEYVDTSMLLIDKNKFIAADLKNRIIAKRKFDLAMSLEVAEHLPSDRAESFVYDLTRLSDIVLFSAAIPGQGGSHHINEKWLSYWAELFGRYEYCPVDYIRPKIWARNEVCFWYKQNIMLFCKRSSLGKFKKISEFYRNNQEMALNAINKRSLDIIHPEMYLSKLSIINSIVSQK